MKTPESLICGPMVRSGDVKFVRGNFRVAAIRRISVTKKTRGLMWVMPHKPHEKTKVKMFKHVLKIKREAKLSENGPIGETP